MVWILFIVTCCAPNVVNTNTLYPYQCMTLASPEPQALVLSRRAAWHAAPLLGKRDTLKTL